MGLSQLVHTINMVSMYVINTENESDEPDFLILGSFMFVALLKSINYEDKQHLGTSNDLNCVNWY